MTVEQWAYLNSRGIYTIEEFIKAYEETSIDISCFVLPPPVNQKANN